MARRKQKSGIKKAFSAIITIIVLLFAAWQIIPKLPINNEPTLTPAGSDGLLTCHFLDVDQADAELIFLPDGKTALIDAGDRGDGEEIVNYIKNQGISKIDYLIATHPHADHIGGMSDVIDYFEIGEVFAPKVADDDLPTSKTYEDFLTSITKKSVKTTAAKAGATLFEGEDYKAECLSPSNTDYDDLNHYSVVVKITYGIHSILFTGDAEMVNETEMLKGDYNLKSDLLKVGHHGSDSSSSKKFLKAVEPKYAIISCGEGNDYGHPHKEPLERLEKLKNPPKIYRTDIDKTIIVKADGKTENGIEINTNNPTVVD